ncbi:probable glutathione S-transferase parA [Pistacia vera]|uniref:probable glutathione S-transferase parA n=1 Tax=Pistacia vera TaxID=55513 RepID=UPI0012639FB2|nr:probable glutathione S-transferase parA [Pistacia vera]
MEKEVVLLDFWPSSFAMRVKIALAEKGIKYECREENLFDKSPLLVEMNPVHKKIPVLIHNGKPICESLVIVQYIDEVWHHSSHLLPSHPYLRSQAKFWADYIDKNLYSIGKRIWAGKGEDQELAKKELIVFFRNMEGELGDKLYFGGESFGFVDVALVPFTAWFYTYETRGNFSIEVECPKLIAWAKRCMEKESVSKTLPHPHKIYDYAMELKKKLGIE